MFYSCDVTGSKLDLHFKERFMLCKIYSIQLKCFFKCVRNKLFAIKFRGSSNVI